MNDWRPFGDPDPPDRSRKARSMPTIPKAPQTAHTHASEADRMAQRVLLQEPASQTMHERCPQYMRAPQEVYTREANGIPV